MIRITLPTIFLSFLLACSPMAMAADEQPEPPTDELKSIYAAHNNQPYWDFSRTDNGAALTAFIDTLRQSITYHGLRAEDYSFDLMTNVRTGDTSKDRAWLDLLVTTSLLRLAHDLHGDRVDLDDDYAGWNFHRTAIDIPALLAAAMQNGTSSEFISSLAPKNPAYARLANTLAAYRTIADKGGWKKIDGGPTLQPGDKGSRVLQLRARLQAEDYALPDEAANDHFDAALQKAVTAYQSHNGLDADGQVGEKTLEALNVSVADRIEQIRANMERWRHMPDDFPPERYATINIADASLHIIENGQVIYEGPVVIGKVDRKTPFIQSRIRSMIVNPYWHVPAKIARKDILPKLRRDPHYLEKLGFVISGNDNDPYGDDIDWATMPAQEFNFRLRQSPGEQNSLGHIKFDFDNDFAVYMHGTPHQELFDKSERTLSSGCIRLRDPDKIGEILLKDTPDHWDTEKLQSEVDSGKTRWVGIKNPMPLYVLYWSVFTGDDGAIQFRKDVYDYDRIMEPVTVPATASRQD